MSSQNGVVNLSVKAHGAIIADKETLSAYKPVLYVISTTYEEYRTLQIKYQDIPLSFLYVYNPSSLLTVDPAPVDVLNLFDLSKVALPEERLWDGFGLSTYVDSDALIKQVLADLVVRYGTRIHTSIVDFLSQDDILTLIGASSWAPNI